MDYKLSKIQSDELFSKLKKDYLILAPKVFKGEGRYSDLDSIRYGEVSSFVEINKSSTSSINFSSILAEPILIFVAGRLISIFSEESF